MRSPNDSREQASAARKVCAPVWRNACGFRSGMPASAPSSARAALTARGTARCRGPLRRLAFPTTYTIRIPTLQAPGAATGISALVSEAFSRAWTTATGTRRWTNAAQLADLLTGILAGRPRATRRSYRNITRLGPPVLPP
jgi:hypothetical protein